MIKPLSSPFRFAQRVAVLGLVSWAALASTSCSKKEFPTQHYFTTHGEDSYIEVADTVAPAMVDIAYMLKTYHMELERIFDTRKGYSEISEINDHAAQIRMPLKSNLERLLRYAVDYNEKTEGAFDISLGSLHQMWGFDGGEAPNEITEEVAMASISSLGMERVVVANGFITFKTSLIKLDPSAMLDGYLADLTILKLRDNLHHDVLVRIGNSSRSLGIDSTGNYWTHPVYHPVQTNQTMAAVKLKDRVAASTSYRNAKWVDGTNQRIHHIVNPKTGLSAQGILSATVVGSTANKTDALATALVVGGTEKARHFLRNFEGCEAMLVLDEQPPRIWMSEGFEDYVDFNTGHGMQVDTFSQFIGIDTLELLKEDPNAPVSTNVVPASSEKP